MKIRGKQHYLWRAVDQDGEVVDVFLQKRRDGKAAKRFFKRLLRKHKGEPRKIATDKLRSYGVAHRELIPETINDTSQYANNRCELSHVPTRVRERGMRILHRMTIAHAQNFVAVCSLRIKNQSDNADEVRRYRQLDLQTLVEVNWGTNRTHPRGDCCHGYKQGTSRIAAQFPSDNELERLVC